MSGINFGGHVEVVGADILVESVEESVIYLACHVRSYSGAFCAARRA